MCRQPLLSQHPALLNEDSAALLAALKGAEHASDADVDAAFRVPHDKLMEAEPQARPQGQEDGAHPWATAGTAR